MLQKHKLTLSFSTLLLMVVFSACSSNVKKADIAATANPAQEVQNLEKDISNAVTQNTDVLAPKEFKNSKKWLKEAKSDLASGEKQEEILDDVRTGRGFLEKAQALTEARANHAITVFEARKAAIAAGVLEQSSLQEDLNKVDKDVSAKSDKLEKVSAADLAEFQNHYSSLEKRATVLTQLGDSLAKINGAKKQAAQKRAPATLKKTELSLKNAETVISANVRNPSGYQDAVEQVNTDAGLLMDVLAVMNQNGGLAEPAALKMVAQNREIKNLKGDLNATTKENRALSSDLASASVNVNIQKAIEAARTQFTPDEAEAYQQGENLVIRIKKINFASGRSDLPAASLPILAKVSEVAKSLNASEIKVEGHTDSVGTAQQNKAISTERASAVATYLKTNGFENTNVQSEGYGFEKPISTNKSKIGRAQNRRVDIVITPKTM